MNNELMRDVNFIRCSTMIAELLMKYKSMETEEDQEGWMQEASSPLLFGISKPPALLVEVKAYSYE